MKPGVSILLQNQLGSTLLKTTTRVVVVTAEYTAEQNVIFMEHERDYLLFLQKVGCRSPTREQERSDGHEMVTQLLLNQSERFTPWFKIISALKLFSWWLQLKKGNNCELDENDQKISLDDYLMNDNRHL